MKIYYVCERCGDKFPVRVGLATPEEKTKVCPECIRSERRRTRRKYNKNPKTICACKKPDVKEKHYCELCGKEYSPDPRGRKMTPRCDECYEKEKEKARKARLMKNGAPDEIIRWAKAAIWQHKNKGHDVQFDYEDLVMLALKHEKCQICGIKFTSYSHGERRSFDRAHNGRAYDISDVGIICVRCNAIKGDLGIPELKQYLSNFMKYVEEKEKSYK